MNRRIAAAVACVLFVSATAEASPCDDARDAWRVVDASRSARHRGEAADVERAAAALTAASCTPSGANREWIVRARLEARLAVLETHADIALAAVDRVPVTGGSHSGDGYRRWMRTTLSPWLIRQLAAIRIVSGEATDLAHDANAEPSIAVDALSAMVQLEASLVTALESVPMPDEFRADPALARAYRESIETNTATIVRAVRDGYDRITQLERRSHTIPSPLRRAEAFLALRNELSAADRNAAHAASSEASAASASPSPGGSVVAGGVRATGDAGLPSSAIRETVQTAQEALETCYERALDQTPTLRGDIALRFVIGVDGRVSATQITRAEPPLRGAADCLVRTVRGLRFTPPRAPVTVDYPFHLEPTAPSPNTTAP